MSDLFTNVSCFDLQELILDCWCDVSNLEKIKECEKGLTGNDLTFAQMHNEGISVEIRIINKKRLAIMEEVYRRVRIK